MSQFKRFDASENTNWDTGAAYPAGTLTWDQDNGLRIHDGYTNGGSSVGGSSSVSWGDIESRPNGSTAVHDLIGYSSSLDNGKFLKQNSMNNSTWAYPSFLDYQGLQLSVLSDGSISLPNGSIIDNQKAIDHIVGGADILVSELAYASQGNPSGAVITSDSYTNEGWQYIMFDDVSVYNNVTGMTGTSNGYFPVTWAAGSTQRTGYVVIQFLGGNQLQICPVLNDTDGNNTPVSGTWKFPLNIRGSVVYNGNIKFTVGSDLGNKEYTLGDNGYISLPAGGSISDFDADDGEGSVGSSLTGTGYAQIYWDGAPGTGNPYTGSDLFSWMYTDATGVTVGYADVSSSKEFEWKFNTDGHLTLPAGGDIKNSSGNSVLSNQSLNTFDSVEFAGLYISGSSANEGGEMRLALAPNTTLDGNGVSIDVYNNKLRIFENGGSTRGVYIDLSTATTGVGTNLLSSFSGSYNDLSNKPTIPSDVNQLADSSGLLPAAQVRYITKNANFTAEAGKIYWLDSGTTARTVTLPANPTTGDWVKIYDGSLNWQTYNLTVNGNGNNIRTINMGGGMTWNSPASTATLNQQMISPVGPFPASFIWDGTVWSGAM